MIILGRIVLAALAAAACVGLSGCTVERNFSHNLVAANSAEQNAFNQVLLLNILRSRVREPRAYSRFTALRGSASVTSGVGLAVPFLPGISASNPAGASSAVSVTPGISDDVAPLDDQDFYRGILTPVTKATWALYQDQGWPPDLLFHLLVERFEIGKADFGRFDAAVAKVCDAAAGDHDRSWECAAWTQSNDGTCAGVPWETTRGDKRIVILSNEPGDRCERLQFERFSYGLLALGFRIVERNSEPIGPPIDASSFHDLAWMEKLKDSGLAIVPLLDKAGNPVQGKYMLRSADTTYAVQLTNYPVERNVDNSAAAAEVKLLVNPALAEQNQADRTPGTLSITITTRSPDSVIYYLGEIARAQLPPRGNEPKPPTEYRAGGPALQLLNLEEGEVSDPAVSVGFDGKTYSVARGEDDHTMQAFELMKQIFALYNKAASAPATTAVTIVP
jgi:hypothetical protein